MNRFANLADAGRALADRVVEVLDPEAAPQILAVIPNWVPVALPIAAALGIAAVALPVERTDAGPVIAEVPDVSGRIVIVVDDGVETGAVARAAATAIRPHAPAELVLAVPVCSREAMADLGHRYDRIIALAQPFGRRSLAWHFDDFDTIDAPVAMTLLAAQA